MKPDPDHAEYIETWSKLYDQNNYDKGPTSYFLKKSHAFAEKFFTAKQHFPRVIEVGAGTGMHLPHVKHTFDEYWLTDLNLAMLEKNHAARINQSGTNKIIVRQENATALSVPDASFDRLIAAHILEHLYEPHKALREWHRVLKPGGILTLILPCDPGLAWRLGRYMSARKKFVRVGFEYDYWMAREHVNPINNLIAFIEYYFSNYQNTWWPFRITSMDINLFYIAHVVA